jgi:hypothetical protein
MDRITSFRESRRRYTALQVIGFLYILFGAILMAIGGWLMIYAVCVLATVGGAGAPQPSAAPLAGHQVIPFPLPLAAGFSLLWSFGFLFSGLQSIALGAFFRLMIDLEENTRASAHMLDKIWSRIEASPGGVEPLFRS